MSVDFVQSRCDPYQVDKSTQICMICDAREWGEEGRNSREPWWCLLSRYGLRYLIISSLLAVSSIMMAAGNSMCLVSNAFVFKVISLVVVVVVTCCCWLCCCC